MGEGKGGGNGLITTIKNGIIHSYLWVRTKPERFWIIKFMEFASHEVKPSERMLDAGAGTHPYREHFAHARYESTDVACHGRADAEYDFICDLESIPVPDNSYDAIINTQVLEHVEHPQKVIDEFHRILRPGGKLFLTAPQGWGIHEAPRHFFNFTKYGLESLFTSAGFRIEFIRPHGGMFCYLGHRLRIIPSYIFHQYCYGPSGEFDPGVVALIIFPFYVLTTPLFRLMTLILFYFDFLDKKKDFTLGYNCYCVKGAKSGVYG